MKISVAIISWEGQFNSARHIAAQLVEHVDTLCVIYSNATETPESGPGQWVGMPNTDFFGAKFRRALDLHSGDVFLLIHADTAYADWAALAARCRAMFGAYRSLGVWSPDFTHTHWPMDRVTIGAGPGPDLVSVAQTDGIVLALRDEVADRLRQLDYSENRLGWGIDWAAIAYCATNNLLVCRDSETVVEHAKSRGYTMPEAQIQQDRFIAQLTLQEQTQFRLLYQWTKSRDLLRRRPLGQRIAGRVRRVLARLGGAGGRTGATEGPRLSGVAPPLPGSALPR